jgi:hypothetical protein
VHLIVIVAVLVSVFPRYKCREIMLKKNVD